MIDDGKAEALMTWHELLQGSESRLNSNEFYDELLEMADRYKDIGLITENEWQGLVEEATAFYAHSVEGLEGGT